MPSFESVHRDLQTYMQSAWVSTPIALENTDEAIDLAQADADYISVEVAPNVSDPIEVGAGRGGAKQTEGLLIVSIHTASGGGNRGIHGYLDELATLLEYKDEGGAHIRSSTVSFGQRDGKWYVVPVAYNFHFFR